MPEFRIVEREDGGLDVETIDVDPNRRRLRKRSTPQGLEVIDESALPPLGEEAEKVQEEEAETAEAGAEEDAPVQAESEEAPANDEPAVEEEAAHPCDQCDYEAKSAAGLAAHQRARH